MNKKNRHYLIYIVFISLILLQIALPSSNNCKLEKNLREKSIIGRVEIKYIDYKAHKYQTIKVLGVPSSLVIYEQDKSNFYSYVRIGDSIVKDKGSLEIEVIRDTDNYTKVFRIDYGCEK